MTMNQRRNRKSATILLLTILLLLLTALVTAYFFRLQNYYQAVTESLQGWLALENRSWSGDGDGWMFGGKPSGRKSMMMVNRFTWKKEKELEKSQLSRGDVLDSNALVEEDPSLWEHLQGYQEFVDEAVRGGKASDALEEDLEEEQEEEALDGKEGSTFDRQPEEELETKTHFPEQPYDLTLITGASSNHYYSLLFTINNVRKYEPWIPVVVWDFGMDPEHVEKVKSWWNVEYRYFDFREYPDWMHITALAKGQYSWKVIAIYQSAQDYGRVFWLDGDMDLRCDLSDVRTFLAGQGYYGMGLHGSILKWTHPAMFEYLGLSRQDYENRTIVAGGLNAFDPGNPRGATLLQRWLDCAMVLDCIGPPGSNRENHRQDQSALTLLAHDEHMGVLWHRDACMVPHSSLRANMTALQEALTNPPPFPFETNLLEPFSEEEEAEAGESRNL